MSAYEKKCRVCLLCSQTSMGTRLIKLSMLELAVDEEEKKRRNHAERDFVKE